MPIKTPKIFQRHILDMAVHEDDVNVSFEAEWIANSTKHIGWRNFGFQLHEPLKVQLGD
jgi:hypothetical protein